MENKIKFHNFNKMYQELKILGYPNIKNFNNGTDYVNAIKPIPRDFIDVVLKWTPKLERKVGCLLFLRESKEKYDGTILKSVFNDAAGNDRWFICEAIAYNPPLNIDNWVKEIYLSEEYGYSETGMLPHAIAKMFPVDEARDIIKEGFDLNYRVAPEVLGKIGKIDDISFLEGKLNKVYDATHVYSDIKKSIKRIKKREKIN